MTGKASKASAARVWACDCGSTSFRLTENGKTRCVYCGEHSFGADSGWIKQRGSRAIEHARPPVLVPTIKDDKPDFHRQHMADLVTGDDAGVVVVVTNAGNIHTWTDAESDDENQWVLDHLDIARKVFAQYKAQK